MLRELGAGLADFLYALHVFVVMSAVGLADLNPGRGARGLALL